MSKLLSDTTNLVVKGSRIQPKVITENGDLLVEYMDALSYGSCWQVSSKHLVQNSPYFRALLDSNKFAEGALLARQREAINELGSECGDNLEGEPPSRLPTVQISANPTTRLCGLEAFEIFLKILCEDSMDESGRDQFLHALRIEPPSLIAAVIQIADYFNSPNMIQSTLRKVDYSFGKRGKSSLGKFDQAHLKMKEHRIRQNITIAMSMKEYAIEQTMTHTLLITGSKSWANKPTGPPQTAFLQWQYLPEGIEGTSGICSVVGRDAFD